MEQAVTTTRMKWTTLEHKGVAFPPEYQARGITITIRGEKLMLNRDQEELVYAWAKKKDTHYVQDTVFQSNFLADFKKTLPPKFQNINQINELDFSNSYKLADEEKRIKETEKEKIRNMPKEEKKKLSLAKKAERERLRATYGKAIVDGVEVDIANWLVEPPGLFMGRGQHPLRGRWKPRIKPDNVTLNLGDNSPVPEGNWENIVHDHSSTWLATWMEILTDKRKYVWLHDSAELKQNSDKEKYDRAKRLANFLDKVQKEIINRMRESRSTDVNNRKLATVSYLLFKLAMRVGDEKDADEADTVGASTLRVEHIKFPLLEGKQYIEFNFLGKDSVPWQKRLEVNSDDTNSLYKNLKFFMNGKKEGESIFDGITSRKVNVFLQSLDPKNVPGLTAKAFRTCIATKVVQKSLSKPPINVEKNSSEAQKVYVAKMANLRAAITCNHKKGIDPRNPASKKALEKFEDSVAKKKEAIEKLKTDIAAKNWKTDLQRQRVSENLEKINVQLKLQIETRDYNLGTSLRNYIDPRIMKSWLNFVGLDWKKVYTSTLQRKFKWVESYTDDNFKGFYPDLKDDYDR